MENNIRKHYTRKKVLVFKNKKGWCTEVADFMWTRKYLIRPRPHRAREYCENSFL